MVISHSLSMSEHLAWARWWTFPWRTSHESWRSFYPEIALIQCCEALTKNKLAGTAPCLPPQPQLALLRLALASTEQLNLALKLTHLTVAPKSAPSLSEDHHLWCMSLSKALAPDMLLPEDDPLQLLCNWVAPTVWQRLRLRFPLERILTLEERSPVFENACSRLITLWQAVIWRATSRPDHDSLPEACTPGEQ
ncbi:type III secretion protein [Pseudomonas fluorescens]|jgi:hypothetical protein|nr:type III secretion protein [Pseudomonas fluorescens]OZO48873.1 type III secretion protein [Pseudomonas fluorescens]TGY19216.1 type III secretion protein [Pseudomonas fluorescens]